MMTLSGTYQIYRAARKDQRDLSQRLTIARAQFKNINLMTKAGDQASQEQMKARHTKALREALGGDWDWEDINILPLLTREEIASAQLEEYTGPATLIAAGVIVSTIGSVISLWVN
jgi:hypothetical protein